MLQSVERRGRVEKGRKEREGEEEGSTRGWKRGNQSRYGPYNRLVQKYRRLKRLTGTGCRLRTQE